MEGLKIPVSEDVSIYYHQDVDNLFVHLIKLRARYGTLNIKNADQSSKYLSPAILKSKISLGAICSYKNPFFGETHIHISQENQKNVNLNNFILGHEIGHLIQYTNNSDLLILDIKDRSNRLIRPEDIRTGDEDSDKEIFADLAGFHKINLNQLSLDYRKIFKIPYHFKALEIWEKSKISRKKYLTV